MQDPNIRFLLFALHMIYSSHTMVGRSVRKGLAAGELRKPRRPQVTHNPKVLLEVHKTALKRIRESDHEVRVVHTLPGTDDRPKHAC
jgi:hypothetical protein